MNLHLLTLGFGVVTRWMFATSAQFHIFSLETACKRLACWLFTLHIKKGAAHD